MKSSVIVGALAMFLHGASASLAKDRETVLTSVKGFIDGLCIAPDKQRDSLDMEQACRCTDISADHHGVNYFSIASILAMVQSPDRGACMRDFYKTFGEEYCGASALKESYGEMHAHRMANDHTKPKC